MVVCQQLRVSMSQPLQVDRFDRVTDAIDVCCPAPCTVPQVHGVASRYARVFLSGHYTDGTGGTVLVPHRVGPVDAYRPFAFRCDTCRFGQGRSFPFMYSLYGSFSSSCYIYTCVRLAHILFVSSRSNIMSRHRPYDLRHQGTLVLCPRRFNRCISNAALDSGRLAPTRADVKSHISCSSRPTLMKS